MSKPLIPDSNVDWVERAKKARHEPAPAEAVVVGALGQLVGVLRAADAPWRAAAERATDADLAERIAAEGDSIAALAAKLDARVTELGGASQSAADGAGELPRAAADFDYAQSDPEVEAMLAEDRSRVAAACDRALECEQLDDAVRETIERERQRLAD